MSDNNKNELGYNAEMFEATAASSLASRSAMADGVDNGLDYLEQNHTETLAGYITKTFGWMFAGLLLTFGIAFGMFLSGAWTLVYTVPFLPFALLIAEVVMVMVLSARLAKIKTGTAYALFFGYAALNGLTFATLFVAFNVTTLVYVFGVTALYFGAMALYGHLTKRDLSSLGRILPFALIALIVFGALSMLLNFSGFDTVVCLIGIACFMAYTAYDMQKLKSFYAAYGGNEEMAAKSSIIGALQLYLDFVNIFLYILRLLGRRK